MDIAAAYTLRGLIEVFFEDWKLHEGWGRFAPQFDEEGSSRSLTLSLLLDLLEEFKFYHPGFVVKAILADALYGSGWFMNRAAKVFGTQTISQLSKSQTVRFRNREMSVAPYFATYPGVEITLRIRGWKEVKVVLGSARLYVKAHQQKRFVVALKYEGEEDYRYLVASDLSWRAVDIAARVGWVERSGAQRNPSGEW